MGESLPIIVIMDPQPIHFQRLNAHFESIYTCVYADGGISLLERCRELGDEARLIFIYSPCEDMEMSDLMTQLRALDPMPDVLLGVPVDEMTETMGFLKAGNAYYTIKPLSLALLSHAVTQALIEVDIRDRLYAFINQRVPGGVSVQAFRDLRASRRSTGDIVRLEDFTGGADQGVPMKLLLVEDDHVYRGMLSKFLFAKYRLGTTSGMHDTLAWLESNPDVDIIVLDLYVAGFRAPRDLGAIRELCPNVVIVGVLDYHEIELLMEVAELGIWHSLIQPFYRYDLMVTVATAAQRYYALKLFAGADEGF